jgi:ribosomal protein L11 methyltransferase
MDYIEIICTLAANNDTAEVSEIAIAFLSELGFESFEELDDAVKAYIPAGKFNAPALLELTKEFPQLIASVDTRCIEQENWNHVWESNFPMTEIAGRVAVYAPFHTDVPALEYRICILPQMSFGTGHHETTSLMIEMMLGLDMPGKRVLDMGCGTGILAIFAAMRKAHPVTAIDIDEWAYRNAAENCGRNGISGIEILQGDSNLLAGRSFDLVLANITRNILLEDIAAYAKCLSADGLLQVSGFYTSDFPDITDEAQRNGLRLARQLEKKNWVTALYRKE